MFSAAISRTLVSGQQQFLTLSQTIRSLVLITLRLEVVYV